MLNKILSLSQELITLKTTPDNRLALEKCLELCLVHLKEYTVEKFEKNGFKSILVYNTKKRPDKFTIILNGHLDIIPGKDFQYSPKIVKNKLYGAGAMDMKSNVACLIYAFKEISNKVTYPVALQLVTDEEIGGFNGTKYQIENGVKANFILAGESTNFNIVNKAKGIVWVKISVKGKTAHGAYPWKGENAIWKMTNFLNILEKKYPILKKEKWETTINLSKIKTNNDTFNKIPDDCEVWLDVRYIPEETKTIVNKIKKLLPIGFTMDVIAKEPSLNVDKDNKYIQLLKTEAEKITNKKITLYGAQGSSDSRHYSLVNCDGIEFGPVGGGIGSDDEWVDISSLEKYTHILTNFLLHIK